ASRIGKVKVIRKLAVHWAKPAIARPEPRIWLGNISPSMIHITGPQDTLKKITYRLAEISASTPMSSDSISFPASSSGAPEKAKATSARVMVIPTEPIHSSGLRPIRSTRKKVIKQAAILTEPETTLISSEWLSEKPAACQSTAP